MSVIHLNNTWEKNETVSLPYYIFVSYQMLCRQAYPLGVNLVPAPVLGSVYYTATHCSPPLALDIWIQVLGP